MKKLLAAVFLMALALRAGAVVIEGTTPSGKFKAVGLTEDGRFKVETSTGVAQHVIVDSGTITAFQGGTWAVTTAAGSAGITVTASTSTAQQFNQGMTGVGPSIIYPADPQRRQGVICNSTPPSVGDIIIYFGDAGVGTGTGGILTPGSCFSPDVPSSFVGAIHGVSTTTANYWYWYSK